MYRQPEVCHFDKGVNVAGPSSMEVRHLLSRNNKNGKEKEQGCYNMKINRWSSSLHRTAHMMYGGREAEYLFHTHVRTHKRP